jgi:hypothetical protein
MCGLYLLHREGQKNNYIGACQVWIAEYILLLRTKTTVSLILCKLDGTVMYKNKKCDCINHSSGARHI